MDYSLRRLCSLTVLALACLNPYSNGLLSEVNSDFPADDIRSS